MAAFLNFIAMGIYFDHFSAKSLCDKRGSIAWF